MALRNPYSEYGRRGEVLDERQALVDALDEAPMPTAHTRTPGRTPQQTREMLAGPGGRTQYMDPREAAAIGRNAYSGEDALPEAPVVKQPPVATAQTQDAQPYNPQRGFGLIDEYDDPYTRRMEGSAGVASSAAKGASLGGSIVPGWGHAIGGAAGAIGALFTKNAPTAMTDFAIDDARQIISQAHKDAFGRDITPEYLDQIVRGQGWEDGDRWMGQDQLAYVLDAFAQQAPGDRAEQAAAAAATPAAGGAAPAAGALGDYAGNLEGFAMERFADPGGRGNNTIKYQVGRVLSRHPPNAEGLAAAAEELRGMGIDVTQGGRNGDLLEFGADVVDDQGNPIGTIDVGRGFGAAGSGWAWQPGGGGGVGGTAQNAQDAYAQLASSINPNASKEEMESAIAAAFGHLPGYGGAYKESVMLNGQWYDLVRGYGGAGAEFQGLVPKDGGAGGAGASAGGGALTGGSNLAPGAQLAAPLGRSDVLAQIQAELDRLLRGEPPRDELLEALG